LQGNATSGTFMFEIMQKDVIRVWVYVPQHTTFGVAPGVAAVVRVPELPDRELSGTVTRIADAQQSGTRTLLTEVDLPNPDGVLRSGVYCMVELKIPTSVSAGMGTLLMIAIVASLSRSAANWGGVAAYSW
jgi:multidrug efflux pump subunit AcrA (membrane-fusion protein)